MNTTFVIREAHTGDAPEVATMLGELLAEITRITGQQAFNFDFTKSLSQFEDFLDKGRYFVFVARTTADQPAGFIALCESYALYTEGVFGSIPEFYIRPGFREQGLGLRLLSQAKAFAAARGWKRLEVTTPPLPQFDRTLAFYEREGFSISGGRKLKMSL
ncbi:GNAT family N-acetyltransferase [Uliginosibacterium sp. 31-12]|uniref:GNAT family N-acetyltransferase n=1 Tax=Uliginosibacterium sp. 31-12 TaxID=3062781 RepID=UPI0026E406DD|nr:N-acetyltransferase [Uliginosibacterium sp. 31-12]MDO6385006.1 N-acetyltransferase [Uliginosibacterium sp. 31-12]